MCGIFCSISLNEEHSQTTSKVLKIFENKLKNRGPNQQNTINDQCVCFYSSVLWQHGHKPLQQPLINEQQILVFNGDIFNKNVNFGNLTDTELIFNKILKCENEDELIAFLKNLEGAYCIIFLNKLTRKLYFLRDSLGRNSLLLGKIDEEIFITSVIGRSQEESINIHHKVIELPPLGLFVIDLKTKQFQLTPWNDFNGSIFLINQLKLIENLLNVEFEINQQPINPKWLNTEPITNSVYNFNFASILEDKHKINHEILFPDLLKQSEVSQTCHKIIELLEKSVKDRVTRTPKYCKNCIITQAGKCYHSRIGVLFSGGLDCTILSILADKFIDPSIPIDLLNVSFEKVQNVNSAAEINWNVPDRISAKATVEELRKIKPERRWNLVEINITRKELTKNLVDNISELILPLTSVLDESLGCALWFASRGKGILNDEEYKSPCRVLLLGSGADELFGGYTRHRNAFLRENNENSTTLKDELELDWIRLPSRNLARDDRVISDHGVTVRAPYLEEDVVQFVRNLEPLQKCYHKLDRGVGDKLLLRLCGFKLGLRNCSVLRKRALQFGSRIADSKQNAKDISQFLI